MRIRIDKQRITKDMIEETLGVKIKSWCISDRCLDIEIDEERTDTKSLNKLKQIDENKDVISTKEVSDMENKIENLRKIFNEGKVKSKVIK